MVDYEAGNYLIDEFYQEYDPDMSRKDVLELAEKYSDLISIARYGEPDHMKSIMLFELSRDLSIQHIGKRKKARELFQFFNKEFNDALYEHLKSYKRIVEVGAGNGMLSYVLKKRGLSITATDNMKWKLDRSDYGQDVFNLDYKAAMKLNPDCVISCWMPYRSEWTSAFRKQSSVKSYILIGEGAGGCTGSELSFQNRKGWSQTYLQDVENFAIARSDHNIGKSFSMYHTRVLQVTRDND